MPINCFRRRKHKLYIKCTERNAKERISALFFVVDLITRKCLSSLLSLHFQVVNLFCAKSQYDLKLASASAPSSNSCSKNFDNIQGALVVGCFVTVTAVEAKAEKAVDFTCTKSAVGGLGAIRLNLEMKQLFPPFGGDNTIAFFFASRERSIDRICFLKAYFSFCMERR